MATIDGVMAPRKKKPEVPAEPDRHKQPKLAFHLPRRLRDAFRDHIESLKPKPPESEVLRMLVERYLEEVGKLPPPDRPSKS